MRKAKILLALGIALSPLAATVFNTDVAYGNTVVESQYKVEVTLKTYQNAYDAKNKTNAKSEYQAGNYYIYKESNGMLNISKAKGKAGAWINPEENKKQNVKDVTNKIQTGWVKEGTNWYYKDTKGQNLKNQWIEGKYYLDTTGKMVTNTWTPDGYYVDENGVWVQGKIQQTGWVKEGNFWYYKNTKGEKLKNQWIEGKYYLKIDGKMAVSEWVYDDNYKSYYYTDVNGVYVKNKWIRGYYLKADGKMAKNEWIYDDNYKSYYYVNADGVYAINSWQGDYYLKSDGKMAANEWIYDTQSKAYYYFISSGMYAKNSWMGNYYLEADGKMAVSKWIYDNYYKSYYYVDENGVYVSNKWIGDYYLASDGKLAVSRWISGGYYVDENGKWDPNKKTSGLIFLDPGHGGKDPGAVNSKNTEKQLNWNIYTKLSEKLRNKGYTVLTSRESDVHVELVDRAVKADNTNADIFISIHFNASGSSAAHGIETYWYQYESKYPPLINKNNHLNAERLRKSEILANRIQNNLIAQTGAKNNGVRRGAYVVVRETKLPAVLLELGYMSNPDEAARIRDAAYQDKLVDGIVAGIDSYYQAI